MQISTDEYLARIQRCTDIMAQRSIDCLLLLPGTNFTYFTGLRFVRERYRLMAALLTREGRLILMGIVFEAERMASGPVPAEIITWTDEENPYTRMAQWIKQNISNKPTIGVELTTNYYHVLGLTEALPGARFVDPTEATDSLRSIKSEQEIECLRQAAGKTQARMARVPSQLSEGMTELSLAAAFGPGAIVQFGKTTAVPYQRQSSVQLKPGDLIVIDAGDRVAGYRSDLARTFFFGEPPQKMRDIYQLVNAAELAAIAATKPGAPAEVVDLAARAVIEKAGLGENFFHRGGHGIGLDVHEFPICARGKKAPLEPGMVVSVEPAVYIPGEFGIRLEDNLLITETGCEILCSREPLFLT